MIYRFTEVLNDLVNYFLLGDILLLEDWKQANHLSDDLAMEFTTNESGDRIFAEGIVIPMTGIENYPYTILFNLSGDRPELCKERNRLQLRKSGYSLKVDHNMLMLFTWPILEQFTPEKVKDLISYYRVHKKPMIELANGWYHIEILGGETLQDGDYHPLCLPYNPVRCQPSSRSCTASIIQPSPTRFMRKRRSMPVLFSLV